METDNACFSCIEEQYDILENLPKSGILGNALEKWEEEYWKQAKERQEEAEGRDGDLKTRFIEQLDELEKDTERLERLEDQSGRGKEALSQIDDDLEDRILDALPEKEPVNVFSLYGCGVSPFSPSRFAEALEALHERGEIFYPKRYHVQLIDGGES